MSGMSIKVTMKGMAEAEKKLEAMRQRASGPMTAPFTLIAAHMMQSVQKTFDVEGQLSKWKKSERALAEGGKTLQRRGRLRDSISFKIEPGKLVIGTSDIRARLLFYGGLVTPKRSKYLTIPWDESVTRRARDYKNTFISKGVIFQKIGKEKIRPLFKLVKSVRIYGRHYIEVTPSDKTYIGDKIGRHVVGEK